MEWIAEKLGKSVDDVKKEILESRLGFEDPSTGQMEIRYKYLSGNVREKLAIAEGYNTDGKYAANVEELRKAVPMDIPSHLIEFSLGSSWIPIELYKDYIKETLDLNNVKLTHVEGAWIFDEGYGYHNEKNRSAGVYSEQFRETRDTVLYSQESIKPHAVIFVVVNDLCAFYHSGAFPVRKGITVLRTECTFKQSDHGGQKGS